MIELLKKIKEILPPKDKFKLGVLFVLMIIGGLLEAISIGLVAGFVSVVANADILLDIEWLSPLLEFFSIKTPRDILLYGSAFLIIVFILKNIYIVCYKYAKARFVFHRYRSISTRLFNIYMNTPYAFHLRRNSADLIRNVSTEVQHLTNAVMLPILQVVTEGVMVIGIVTLLLIVEPVVTLVTLVLLGGISFIFLKFSRKKITHHGKAALNARSDLIKTVNEGMGGLKDVILTGRQNWFTNRFYEKADTLTRANIFRTAIKESVRPIMETIAISGMLVIAIVLLWEGRSISALVGLLALFALAIQRLLPSMNIIISQINSLKYHAYSIDPIYEDIINFKQKDSGVVEDFEFKDKIRVKNVSYCYPQTLEQVVNNVSMTINKGSAVGVVGATGSGKTTIIDIILGLFTPDKGEVLVDGKSIHNNLRGWQNKIGYIPQHIYLSDDTIRNNIAFGIPEENIEEEKIKNAAKVAQLDEFVSRLPEKLNTFIGERGVRLSGGQRQRIGIARAIYNNPEILVMDEATSSLDNITERFVIQAIERLKKDRTLIIIAHRLTTVKNCDKLYVIKKGEIIGEGKYDQLLEQNGDFKQMAQ